MSGRICENTYYHVWYSTGVSWTLMSEFHVQLCVTFTESCFRRLVVEPQLCHLVAVTPRAHDIIYFCKLQFFINNVRKPVLCC